MSSNYVVTKINDLLNTEITATNVVGPLIDIDGTEFDMEEFRAQYGLGPRDPFLGIQYLPSIEIPQGLASDNDGGCYREDGVFLLHVVERVSDDHVQKIRNRGEVLINLFRGRKIEDIYIESTSTLNFDESATLNFENGYKAAGLTINFYRNNNF